MTQEEFLRLWIREAGEQYGMLLDVISLEGLGINDNDAA